jgi:ABC-type nickel/cobalt efflux system permease component RcnA
MPREGLMRMRTSVARILFAVVALSFLASHLVVHAHASSLGIGTNEATIPSTGLFAPFMNWINVQQQAFYRALTGALKAMRDDGGQMAVLVGLSFAYGIFHAAGPGHGKAVISSYMLANEVALRRGVMLSFVSAFLQATTAIVMMVAVYLLLRGTAITMTDATRFLEIASYGLITAFGAWLLWRKAWPRLTGLFRAAPAMSLSAGRAGTLQSHDMMQLFDDASDATPTRPASGSRFAATDADHPFVHGAGDACVACGNAHIVDPSRIGGPAFDWRTAWSAVVAVGLRPCSGALIVMSFALLNGLWLGGVLSVLAMALGTAITVSILATIAVTAKSWAVALAGDGRAGSRIHAGIEIAGALMVFLFGLILLSASLNG